MNLTNDQNQALASIKAFLDDPDLTVFVLKGYAGTGKTTLIRSVLSLPSARSSLLTAPTGRAAKILAERTGHAASTLYAAIYERDPKNIHIQWKNGGEIEETPVRLVFQLKSLSETAVQYRCIIADEASMITDREMMGEYLCFGSGSLLDDLFAFAEEHHIPKLIFVGDPAQLPPVGDNESPALDISYFHRKGYGAKSYTLREPVRTKSESAIFRSAMMVRSLLERPKTERQVFVPDRDGKELISLARKEMCLEFARNYDPERATKETLIAYTNKACSEYNREIRALLFPGHTEVVSGDLLMLYQNTYSRVADNDGNASPRLFNGDIIRVRSVGPAVSREVCFIAKGGRHKSVTLTFRPLQVSVPHLNDAVFDVTILENFLLSDKPSLTTEQMQALFVYVKKKHFGDKTPSREDLTAAIEKDPEYNALRVKFGYAVTCHKAQGGEYERVFVDFSDRAGLDDERLRWCYTAMTRAKERLYSDSFPKITPYDKLTFTEPQTLSSLPVDFYPETAEDPVAERERCFGEALAKAGYRLAGCRHMQYQERYSVITPENLEMELSVFYNKSGQFKPVDEDDQKGASYNFCARLFNGLESATQAFEYQNPPDELARQLYERVLPAASEGGFRITNITEHREPHAFDYFLESSDCKVQIKFYCRKGRLSSVVPYYLKGSNAESFRQLIYLISNYDF